MMQRIILLVLAIAAIFAVPSSWGADADPAARFAQAEKFRTDGNWKNAYDLYSELVLDKNTPAAQATGSLEPGVQCLLQLGRQNEVDAFLEKGIAAHDKSWEFLAAAATQYQQAQHFGFIIAGQFNRGYNRGGTGKPVGSMERDRTRAMQLMDAARVQLGAMAAPDKLAAATFYMHFSEMLLNDASGRNSWRLAVLSDLKELPDYDETNPYPYYRGWNGGNTKGAPVNPDGSPVLHQIPKSWEVSKTDGERWRWCLLQAAELGKADEARFAFAQFLHQEFGVQTMATYGYRPLNEEEEKKNESSPFAVSTLGDGETIAKLATGIKRFKLADEFNPIKMYRAIMQDGKGPYAEESATNLAQMYEDRQQYMKAAAVWKDAITAFGAGSNNWRQARLDQIEGNWGVFESVGTLPSGTEPVLGFKFRNAAKMSVTATQIDLPKFLAEVQAYLKSKPARLDWQETNIENLGWRIVEKNQALLTKTAEKWDVALSPRPDHQDRYMTVKAPIKAGGAWLVEAKVDGGNTTRVIVWMADGAIVKKTMNDSAYYFVADAVTGEPLDSAKVSFFGYRSRQIGNGNNYTVDTLEYEATANANGEVLTTEKDLPTTYNWLTTARSKDGGKLAYMGFESVWYPRSNGQYDAQYNQVKVFGITDRPVYRPSQTVKYKFWVNRAQYDREGRSPFAQQRFTVRLMNPKGEKVTDISAEADDFGGFDGEFAMDANATLGSYGIQILQGQTYMGGESFRVEEYKKPEFEVTIDAPKEPVMLGEKISATIKAKYYFGSPVTQATVKYKVMRSNLDARWYPAARWDWMYGTGYWWFAYDYAWYPGWGDWGSPRPHFFWWPSQSEQPELVAEAEAPIGPDGTVKVEIDTAVAKAIHADEDHRYSITAEVTDDSRRTIVGTGDVSVARKPFKVYAWVDRGFYRMGDAIHGEFSAQTVDNKPIKGKGELKLLSVSYDKEGKPVEEVAQKWALDTGEDGRATQQITAAAAGQYRLSYTVTDDKGHAIEGAYMFVIRDTKFDGATFRFNDIELITDKKDYKAGDTVKLMINTERANSTVVLFVRPSNGVYLMPKVVRLTGKSAVEDILVAKKDMPNFFVEAFTISNAKVYDDMREIVVPPEDRVLNVAVTPSGTEFKPGEKAKLQIKVTEQNGEPYNGSAVVSLYDKSVEYISGGSNVSDIKDFFWKWRRTHYPSTESTLSRQGTNVMRSGEVGMSDLGVFGALVALTDSKLKLAEANTYTGGIMITGGGGIGSARGGGFGGGGGGGFSDGMSADAAMPMPTMAPAAPGSVPVARSAAPGGLSGQKAAGESNAGAPAMVEPTVRSNFADTALWVPNLVIAKDGLAEVELTMPENLTTWKAKVWTMANGSRVGSGDAEIVTRKNLIVRLEAPRFFVQKDEVVLSAVVHNYLKSKKSVSVVLELDGGTLSANAANAADHGFPHPPLTQTVEIEANAEKRVDWTVTAMKEGNAIIRMKALTDEESDATQMSFPVYVHGMLKTESWANAMNREQTGASLTVRVPAERRPDQTRLEVRYSPSVAMAMVDALPYLADYPYGCTEQTVNRFVPTVITQKVLQNMKLDLKAIRDKRVNLNAQEIGDDVQRAQQWKRMAADHDPNYNPVFDEAEVRAMVKSGVLALESQQISDGGWGWFSGYNEVSYPHTTAVVVHGLQTALASGAAVPTEMLTRGVDWLKHYQAEQITWIKNYELKKANKDWNGPYKEFADDLDAFTYMVLVDANAESGEMREFLYRDRTHLAVYSKATFGLALTKVPARKDELTMILKNIEQYVVQDDENQTAYLKMPEGTFWWCWYGTDTEANAFYLKLLAMTDPKGAVAPRLAKYIINNRRHASYWNSTRDTAYSIEALAAYIKASGEDSPDMTVKIAVDGKPVKEVKITSENLFSYDNKLVMAGLEVGTGDHKIEFSKSGNSPLYYNAYLTNFTLEDPITKAGLEIKVQRKYYKLQEVDKSIKAEGDRGQAVDQKVQKYKRIPLDDNAVLKSGDLVEVELEIDSKNDYEYILFEDMKASGFEPVDLQSGYNGNDLHAYMELHDERVCFFARELPRGKSSVSYRIRAEIPGAFSAMPTKASAMYSPELKANSDEYKVQIKDK